MFEADGKIPVDINYLRSQFIKHEPFLRACYGKKRTALKRTIELAYPSEIHLLIKIFYVEFHGAIPIEAGKIKKLFTPKLMTAWKKNFSSAKQFSEFQLTPIQEKKKFVLRSIKVIPVCLSPILNNGST